MNTRSEAVKLLVDEHAAEPTMVAIREIRATADERGIGREAICLLEVNEATESAGIMPIAFGPSRDVPFPCVILEITPSEWAEVERGALPLPDGWTVGEVLYQRKKAS